VGYAAPLSNCGSPFFPCNDQPNNLAGHVHLAEVGSVGKLSSFWGAFLGKSLKAIATCAVFLISFYLSSTVASATVWHIRHDGGTNTQCTGTTNAAYPGTGTGVTCAYNHPFQMLIEHNALLHRRTKWWSGKRLEFPVRDLSSAQFPSRGWIVLYPPCIAQRDNHQGTELRKLSYGWSHRVGQPYSVQWSQWNIRCFPSGRNKRCHNFLYGSYST
jgi:hypothetical protein